MKLQLQSNVATIGAASHIALVESELEFTFVNIDMVNKQQQSSEYLRINPKARVPSLIVDGKVLTETPAILFYLAQIAPDSSIALPQNALEQANIQSFNSYLCSTVHVAHAHKMRGSRWSDDTEVHQKLTEYVPTSMAQCMALIEDDMIQGPWVHGEQFSISDPYLFAICSWLEGDGVSISNYPLIAAHYKLMLERPAVKQVLAIS